MVGKGVGSAFREDEVRIAFYADNVQIFFSLFSKCETQKEDNDKISSGNAVRTTNQGGTVGAKHVLLVAALGNCLISISKQLRTDNNQDFQ